MTTTATTSPSGVHISTALFLLVLFTLLSSCHCGDLKCDEAVGRRDCISKLNNIAIPNHSSTLPDENCQQIKGVCVCACVGVYV